MDIHRERIKRETSILFLNTDLLVIQSSFSQPVSSYTLH